MGMDDEAEEKQSNRDASGHEGAPPSAGMRFGLVLAR